ncbi:HupE/UreJ family protein [Rhodoplanes sp. TEM]|uniref:HupE/UreJ family protein n=1 Tax=Rhodoplanes tepidamans TaxID=200616 RepID=A0ABT5JGZ9_RHOTP|nr:MULTISPECIES: HupE/UreJ family protein [Rhodoplanes]MDC7788861.1 HupE/UreJ family protein [Rhodoplanes tepidamans]MDC7986708.1 HupE/UreJ family protein [Rhodoplanes sp. TEM]MDQ0357838.1 hydrogenase/urease accessory protein HupE [Rhodoplanes tepidamans]
MRTKARLLAAATVAAALAAPTAAHAHLVDTRLGDFYGGALHPLTELDQLLPWVALAALAAFQGARRARWVIVAFPLALLAGGAAALLLPAPPFGPILGIGLVAATGLALAAAARLPLPVLIGLSTVMGLLHGLQNGQGLPASTDRLLFLAGATAAGYAVMTLATGGALAFLRGVGGWRPIALRATGSWVAAVGIMVLGLQFAAPATAG